MAANTFVSKDLRIVVNGTVVTGRHVRFYGSSVRLDAPYRGFSIARSAGSGKAKIVVDKRSPTAILKMLYEVVHFTAENIVAIDRSERELGHQMRLLSLDDELETDDGLEFEKGLLEERLRGGKVNRSAYDKALIELRVRHSLYHEARAKLVEEWWESTFPMRVEASVRSQIEGWLAVYRRSAVPIETNQN